MAILLITILDLVWGDHSSELPSEGQLVNAHNIAGHLRSERTNYAPKQPSFWSHVEKNANSTAIIRQKSKYNSAPWIADLDRLGIPKKKKILVMPPIVFESHLFIFKAVGSALKRKYGHEMHFLLGDRRHDAVALDNDNMTDNIIKRYPSLFSSEEASTFVQLRVQNILSGYPMMVELYEILGRYTYNCDLLFTEGRAIIENLRKEAYDMVLVDPNELCGFLLAKELGVPHAALSTGLWTPAEANLPQPVSYVPEFNSLNSDVMSFWGRASNLLAYVFCRIGTHLTIFPLYNALIRKHMIVGPPPHLVADKDLAELFGRKGLLTVQQKAEQELAATLPDETPPGITKVVTKGRGYEWINSMIKRTKLWLIASDFALDFPKPYTPVVEFVGGLLSRPGKPLPPDLQEWADNSTGGFVVVTFGAAVKKLTPRLQRIYVTALSELPYPVVWRAPKSDAPTLEIGSNVKLLDWIPQNDLLAHPNCALFVSHGGTNGAYEALYHGVPMVGMPLFGDHYDSATRFAAKGIGRMVSWRSLTAQQLLDAMLDVLTDPSYRTKAKFYSRVHRDFHANALERAVDRLDYTLRYKGADHLRPAVFDISFVQFYLLDVLLAFTALIAFLIVAVRFGQTLLKAVEGQIMVASYMKKTSFVSKRRNIEIEENDRPGWRVLTAAAAAWTLMRTRRIRSSYIAAASPS